MADKASLQRQIDDLTVRIQGVRTVKHQMCNELMGAIGHSQLLSQHPELSDKARQRIARIREHCKNLTDQADELSRLCLGVDAPKT